MQTLYLKIDDIRDFVGKGRKLESQIKFFKKDVTLYKIKDDVPSSKRYEVRVPDDVDLKKTGAYVFSALALGFKIANRKGVISFDTFNEEQQTYQSPTGIQDKLFDAMTRRQIGILRYGKTLSEKIKSVLKESDKTLKDRILGRLENWQGIQSNRDKEKIDKVLTVVKEDRLSAWVIITGLFKDDLKELAVNENVSFYNTLQTVLPFVLPYSEPSLKEVKNIVETVDFKGKTLDELIETIQVNDLARVKDAIKIGAIAGETEQEIAKRIMGNPVLDGAGGVSKVTADELESLTMSSVNLVSTAVKDNIIQKDDIIDKVVFVAVLDSRTTAVCRSLDGKVFEKGKGYKPPLHLRCRSQLIPLINIKTASRRALHLKDEETYVSEFMNDKGFTTRADIPRGRKGEYDKWLLKRLENDIGTLNTDIRYEDWLRRQPAYFQDFTLGQAKAKLFREGGLGLEKFVNPDGGEVTLSVLAKTETQSFIDAGLDPNKYKP